MSEFTKQCKDDYPLDCATDEECGKDFNKAINLLEKVEQQRDDLLKVCKDARATFVGYVEGSFAGQILKKMEAAIAKCET